MGARQMKKKVMLSMFIALSFLFVAGGVVAVNESQEPDPIDKMENRVLEIAVFEGGYGADYWQQVARAFEKDYPGTQIHITSNPQISSIIKARMVGGQVPDFIYLPTSGSTNVPNWLIQERALLDLTPIFEENVPFEEIKIKDKLLEGILEQGQFMPYGDGKVYLAPLYYDVMGLFYNKQLLKENNWELPRTWDEFFELGEEAKKKGIALYTYPGMRPGFNDGVILPALASLIGEEGLQAFFEYEEGVWKKGEVRKVFNLYRELGEGGYLLEGSLAFNNIQAQKKFYEGNVLFIPSGNWIEREMYGIAEKSFEIGFMPVPSFKEHDQKYVSVRFQEMYIPKDAPNRDLAIEFLKYQYTDKAIALNQSCSQGMICVKDQLQSVKGNIPNSAYEAYAYALDERMGKVIESWKLVKNTPYHIRQGLFNPIGEVIMGNISVDEWVEQVEGLSTKLRETILAYSN